MILRGQDKATLPTGSADYGVVQVYLLRMDRIIFSGGGVQYQQMVADPGGAPAGWFDFVRTAALHAAVWIWQRRRGMV